MYHRSECPELEGAYERGPQGGIFDTDFLDDRILNKVTRM